MLLLVWLLPAVVSPNSLPVCGSLLKATHLALQVGSLSNSLRFIHRVVAFTSYGAFWFSYSALLIPGTGIGAAYKTSEEFDNAIGIYLMTWATVTSLFLLVSPFFL